MFTKSEIHNPNYLAKIQVIDNLRPHPNADRLQMSTIDGNNVITDLSTKVGDVGIYFPLECKINAEYLKANNQFEDRLMNENTEIKGFFNKHGRVRAISLRSAKSEGFWTPISTLGCWKPGLNLELVEHNLYFDTVDGSLLCQKYVPRTNPQALPRDKKAAKGTSKLLEGQFRFHEDTEQLGRNLERVELGDRVVITQKLHGTSAVFSNVLCRRPLTLKDRIARWFGVCVQETEYSNLYSSRRVLKNARMEPQEHYYGSDIWGEVNKLIQPFLEAGITVYGEIVGYASPEKIIQKGYDYGCAPGTWAFYVYRITTTNVDGKVIELMWDQVKDYCQKYGLVTVPEYESYVLNPPTAEEHWRNKWLEDLDAQYLEKKLPNGKPDEGICVRLERGLHALIFKRKSFSFLKAESAALDAEEANIEDEN
jgi:hypothetical protein